MTTSISPLPHPGPSGPATTLAAAPAPPTFASAFAVPEFRGLWVAYLLSLIGDQLTRVALAVLVYQRTSSAGLTAAVYALTTLPWLLGGPLLSGLADRYPRRTVMVTTNMLSAGLVLLLAIPGVPLPLLCAVVVAVVLLEAPFLAARSGLLAQVMPGDRLTAAVAINQSTMRIAQTAGYAAGGAVVAAVGSSTAVALDAATFAGAALIIRLVCPPRPASAGSTRQPWGARIRAGARVVAADAYLRRMVLLGWLGVFTIVPIGLAAPYTASLGGGPATLGLLLAAHPAGSLIGGLLIARAVGPDRRRQLMVPLAALSYAPLLGCALTPPFAVVLGLLFTAGLGFGYQVPANAEFHRAVPDQHRGQALGLVQTVLVAAQGLALLAGGVAAEYLGAAHTTAGAAAVALLLLAVIARTHPGTGPGTDSSVARVAGAPAAAT